jgi:O-antigen biosynthesis protein WbqP
MCVILILPFVVLILIIAIAIYISSSGPILYWSDRVGKNNYIFRMPKFRSMKINTPAIPTHLMLDAKDYLTPMGVF